MLNYILADIVATSNPERVPILQWFFQTHEWGYGEWDLFLGHRVPDLRKIAKKYYKLLTLNEIENLVQSPYHEHRLVWLMMLVYKMSKQTSPLLRATFPSQERLGWEIFELYLRNTKYINNWDLVDVSAPGVVWSYLFEQGDKKILMKLAKSKSLRERRISIVSIFYFIKKNDFNLTLEISKILLNDTHDLIHKAVGRMLREMGKRNKTVLVDFLDEFSTKMPRTMLRYAIEKFPEGERKEWLRKK